MRAAFDLHQSVERAYSDLLLVLTNYSRPSHNLKFLAHARRGRDRRLIDAWPRGRHRHSSWFNALDEAYVKARYSKHYEIVDEALKWLIARTEHLHALVRTVCDERLESLEQVAMAKHWSRNRRRQC